jgi:hypothetical protein
MPQQTQQRFVGLEERLEIGPISPTSGGATREDTSRHARVRGVRTGRRDRRGASQPNLASRKRELSPDSAREKTFDLSACCPAQLPRGEPVATPADDRAGDHRHEGDPEADRCDPGDDEQKATTLETSGVITSANSRPVSWSPTYASSACPFRGRDPEPRFSHVSGASDPERATRGVRRD